VLRASEVARDVVPGMLRADFAAAMDDDLGTPAAMAALHEVVREGNKLLSTGDSPALRGNLASVRAMLGVLGLDPLRPPWSTHTDDAPLREAVDSLVRSLVARREQARADRDWPAADAVRDQLREAGIDVEDTPTGPRWTLKGQP
jgi:cysteinyl-tRNA synthetase